ncbi:N-methyl-L-tryptophan oxidase [Leucobacter sp. wl10]|uniref:N-methyl-L-tryptophan oxidase n=1 Tax=Leucobacter sp. wl10 TaxID=2304677 RepID=UPI000E5C3A25|nr:N-methyl-L-tryptophan oxidase [Leucobacter sp. wl10]RGE22054.1 N-methyl-L-tryptophan oxidase [Leucobacter sp. wl10]
MSRRIAVIGLGAIGAQALWQLSRHEGVEVDGYEMHSVGHGLGASGGDGRVFRTIQYEDPAYVPLIQRAEEIWQRLEAETRQQLRVITGALAVGTAGCGQVVRSIEGIERYGLRVDQLTPSQLRERYPQMVFHDDDVGLYDHDGGLIRPELTILSTVTAAAARGASVFEGTRVLGVDEIGDTVAVRTDRGAREYDEVVVSTGAWAPQLATAVGSGVVQPRKVTSAWFFPREFGALEGLPPFVRFEPEQFYGVPSQDGISIKLGLSGVHHLDVPTPDEADYVVREENFAGFRRRLAEYFPSLQPQPFRLETYFEGYTPDARPVVQKASAGSHVTYAVGFSGHGFKLAPAYGQIVADLALDAPDDPDTAFLRRERETA